MQKKHLISFIQFAIFCNELIISKAIMGPNVQDGSYSDYPFVVPMISNDPRYSMEDNMICTATLLTTTHVLTAEHCFDNVDEHGYRILIGSNNLYRATSFYPFWHITHDQWALITRTQRIMEENDVAMIKLLISIPGNNRVVGFAMIPDSNLFGQQVRIAGWGQLSNLTIPRILKTGVVQIITPTDCQNRIMAIRGGEPRDLPIAWLCSVGNPHIQIGSGDSGGPLLYGNYIVGINFGLCPLQCQGQLEDQRVNVHHSVHFYSYFIHNTMSWV